MGFKGAGLRRPAGKISTNSSVRLLVPDHQSFVFRREVIEDTHAGACHPIAFAQRIRLGVVGVE